MRALPQRLAAIAATSSKPPCLPAMFKTEGSLAAMLHELEYVINTPDRFTFNAAIFDRKCPERFNH